MTGHDVCMCELQTAHLRLFDQPFSLDGLGATLWYVYMHGIFGDADDAPEAGESWQILAAADR